MRGCGKAIHYGFLLSLLSTFVFFPYSAFAQQPATRPRQASPTLSRIDPPTLAGQIEHSQNEYRINLVNYDQRRTVSGIIVIRLGGVTSQNEAIRLRFSLAPLEGMLFPLRPLTTTGDYFTLTVFDREGQIIYERIAPVRKDATSKQTVRNSQPEKAELTDETASNERQRITTQFSTVATSTTQPAVGPVTSSGRVTTNSSSGDLQIKTRLAGGESDNDPFVLAFEITAPRPINKVTLNLTGRGINQKRTVNLNNTTLVEFKLPDELPEQKLLWKLVDSTGKPLTQGDADLTALLEDDYVSVSKAATDRETYAPGETAKVSIELSGSAPGGIKLEVVARDAAGVIIFRDARKAVTTGGRGNQSFSVTLPREGANSVMLEYKVLDAVSDKLFDSGDLEIRIVEKSSGQ